MGGFAGHAQDRVAAFPRLSPEHPGWEIDCPPVRSKPADSGAALSLHTETDGGSIMRVTFAGLIAASFLTVSVSAQAGPPADEIHAQAERILAVLADPALKAPGQERARRRAVRQVAEDAIDFRETGRRTLGAHWEARTDAERQLFVGLFTDLLDRAFLRHVDRWDGERLVVSGDTVDGDHAIVHAKVLLTDGSQVPVDLAVVRCDDARWRVWDVRAMGASLVSSYRAQFTRMLQHAPYEEMVRKLRVKVNSLEP
jgi:phospholipid transport system substrate-binding protein